MKKTAIALTLAFSLEIAQAATGYLVHNLVADTPGVADFTDPNLVNAWGMATSATSPFWTCDGGTGLSTVYAASNTPGAGLGNPITALKPTIPMGGGATGGTCTGIVANSNTSAFMITSATSTTPKPANFIFASEDGTISAWAGAIDVAHAILQVDNSKSGNTIYKGLAIVQTPTPQLYAANFRGGTIDVFDATFKPVTLGANAFKDTAIPAGYGPFNIWNLGGKLYVTYAKQDADKMDDAPGAGQGYVDVYDPSGTLLQHLIAQGPLNAPWGLAIAPANFGKYSNDLLVGNFGDGKINAFNPTTGAYLGTLQDASGKDIVIDGLWSLLVGNGGSGGDTNTLFFTAGPADESHGLLGEVQANPTVAATAITNAAQSTAGIAANTYVTIKGTSLAATKRSWTSKDFVNNQLPSTLDGVTVTMGGKPAFISYISPVQINVLTPSDLPTSGPVDVVVSNNGLTSATATVQAQAVAPSFFLINSDKYVAATHSNNVSVIGPTTLIANKTTPAKPGETIVMYGNGFGPTSPAATNGQIVTAPMPLVATPVILFNNIAGKVVFAGMTASGLYQFNVTLPTGLADGDVPVEAQVSGATSPAGALITIQNQ